MTDALTRLRVGVIDSETPPSTHPQSFFLPIGAIFPFAYESTSYSGVQGISTVHIPVFNTFLETLLVTTPVPVFVIGKVHTFLPPTTRLSPTPHATLCTILRNPLLSLQSWTTGYLPYGPTWTLPLATSLSSSFLRKPRPASQTCKPVLFAWHKGCDHSLSR